MEFNGIFAGFIVLANTAVVLASPGPQSANCEPRPRPDNGQAIFTSSKNWMRAVEVYQCDSGYVMTGQTKHTCVGGEWSGDVPSCARHTGNNNNTVSPAQDWFSFRRILRHDAKRKQRHNNEKQSDSKSAEVETPQQALGNSYQYQIPQQMIRDSVREYSAGDYDLSCLFKKRHGKNFLRAPKLPYAQVVKYSKKKNTVIPNNRYLVAIYHCVKGYVLENPSENRLYCSSGHWVGMRPSCVPRTTPMTMYQMECYIKCPPDRNVTLARGATSTDFRVERPTTNYDWDRFGSLSSGWDENSSRTLAPGLYVITYTVRDDEDADIASCRTTIRVTDDEVPTVRDCPLFLEVIKDFSKKNFAPLSWPEPHFTDNVAIARVEKTVEPSQMSRPGIYNVTYVAMDSSKNQATCKFTVVVKDRAAVDDENRKTNETLNEVVSR